MLNVSNLAIFVVFISLVYYVYSYYCVKAFFEKSRNSTVVSDFSSCPVSILKPLKKVFPAWVKNLETFCNQSYPEFEIIVGTSNPIDAEFREIVKRLRPCRIKVVETGYNPGPNFKVGNLVSALRASKYDILAISDADTKVSPDYLKNIVAPLHDKDVGLVTCLYRGVDCENFFASLEALVVQTDFIPGVLVADRVGATNFAFGATIALKRETLNSIGRFEVLFPYLADDYQLGNQVARKGWKIRISNEIVDHVVGKRSWRDFFRQQLRWAITCRVCQPIGYFFSVLSQGVSLATLNLIFNSHASFSFFLWLTVLVTRYMTCLKMNSKYLKNSDAKKVLWLLPFKDIFCTFVWGASFFVNRVYWAGNYFRVKRDGTMEPVK